MDFVPMNENLKAKFSICKTNLNFNIELFVNIKA